LLPFILTLNSFSTFLVDSILLLFWTIKLIIIDLHSMVIRLQLVFIFRFQIEQIELIMLSFKLFSIFFVSDSMWKTLRILLIISLFAFSFTELSRYFITQILLLLPSTLKYQTNITEIIWSNSFLRISNVRLFFYLTLSEFCIWSLQTKPKTYLIIILRWKFYCLYLLRFL